MPQDEQGALPQDEQALCDEQLLHEDSHGEQLEAHGEQVFTQQ